METTNCLLGDAAVIARIVLTGKLVVQSPLCISDGAGEENQANDKDIHVQKINRVIRLSLGLPCAVFLEALYLRQLVSQKL